MPMPHKAGTGTNLVLKLHEQRTLNRAVSEAGTYRLPAFGPLLAYLIQRSTIEFSLRKEVIQPQVLLRLPCYDFTPIMSHTLGRSSPCGLGRRLLVQPTFVM